MFGGYLVAAVVVTIGGVAGGASYARVVERIAVLPTRHAAPAALILQR